MISRFFLAAVALTFGIGAAQAQNPAPQAPGPNGDVVRVLLENEQVRVIEMRFKPGAKFDTLSQPNRFIYGLSDGALLFRPAGRTPYELSFKSGEALWLPAQPMATQNEGDKEVRALVVELKNMPAKARRAPARAAKAAPRPKPTAP